jgi:stress-induced morphogen
VFAALGDLMQTEIHALAITAVAPGEAQPGR